MKKLVCILLSVLIAFSIAACTEAAVDENTASSEITTTTASAEGEINMTQDNVPTSVPSPIRNDAQNEIVARAWDKRAENILQATAITRLEHVIQPYGGEPQVYSSEANVLITRMKTWLSELHYTIIPFELYVGSFRTTLTFYEGDIPLQLFNAYPTPNILVIEEGTPGRYNDSWKMVRIDDEAQEELMEILREMGVRQWEVVEE